MGDGHIFQESHNISHICHDRLKAVANEMEDTVIGLQKINIY